MCVIIYKPKAVPIKAKTVEDAWDQNPHGAGFAARVGKNGNWVIRKGFMKLEDFKEAVLGYQFNEMLLHFRIATHGAINAENTHPFYHEEGESSVLFHNGILSDFGSKELSDSRDFFIRVVSKLEDEVACHVLNMAAKTNSSKFALIGHSGRVFLAGDWSKHEGLDVSNTNFCGWQGYQSSYAPGTFNRRTWKEGKWQDDEFHSPIVDGDQDWRKRYAKQLALSSTDSELDNKIRTILEQKASDEVETLEGNLDADFVDEQNSQHVSEIIADIMEDKRLINN